MTGQVIRIQKQANESAEAAYIRSTGAGLATNSKSLVVGADGKPVKFKFHPHKSQRSGKMFAKFSAGNTIFAKLPVGFDLPMEGFEGHLLEFRSDTLTYDHGDGVLKNEPKEPGQAPLIPFIKGKNYWITNYFVPVEMVNDWQSIEYPSSAQ